MNNVRDISAHRFASSDRLLLDTSFLFPIFCPRGKAASKREIAYSAALFNMKNAGSVLYIDVLVLSEFINRYARLRHEIYKSRDGNLEFKQWRDGTDFKDVAKTISIECRKIMKFASPVDSGFASVDINDVISEFQAGGHDFNDQMLARKCVADGLTLVTDDADFGKYGIPILTANRRLLT